MAKNGSFDFAQGAACAVGAKANVPFVGWKKIELKSAVEKIKNTEGSAMSVGLLAVYLQYGLYVFGHRSKFINTMQFKLPLVCLLVFGRPTIGYN